MHCTALGIMSGTSLDGVDLALCSFTSDDGKWNYQLHHAETIPYDDKWRKKLSTIHSKSAEELASANAEYGEFLGRLAQNFVIKHSQDIKEPFFISSHGHTIFHQPQNHFTFQLGHGAAIAAYSDIPVVCDFRTKDVALGGQGAPLVPIGDALLFSEYDYCINLGGIANTSFNKNGTRLAFDVCPCNLVLNVLAKELGFEYDEGGSHAASGKIIAELLDLFNHIPYNNQSPPKSLGREDIEKSYLPILQSINASAQDKLHTVCEHIAQQIASTIEGGNKAILLTGGGALNRHLKSRISALSKANIEAPTELVHFKEAIIFGFLGALRWFGEINSLSSVTGASKDSISGCIYL